MSGARREALLRVEVAERIARQGCSAAWRDERESQELVSEVQVEGQFPITAQSERGSAARDSAGGQAVLLLGAA